MGADGKYDLRIHVQPDEVEAFDRASFMLDLHKRCPEAKYHINEDGGTLGMDYDWREPEVELIDFSKSYPAVLLILHIVIHYDGESYHRLFVQNGKHVYLEPSMTWPQFTPELLQ